MNWLVCVPAVLQARHKHRPFSIGFLLILITLPPFRAGRSASSGLFFRDCKSLLAPPSRIHQECEDMQSHGQALLAEGTPMMHTVGCGGAPVPVQLGIDYFKAGGAPTIVP